MTKLNQHEINALAEDALQEAIGRIQTKLGTLLGRKISGDVASHVFSDGKVQAELAAYIAIEIGATTAEHTLVTADTLTDEQIRELRASTEVSAWRFWCSCALTGQNPYTAVGLDDDEWRGTRARVAEIINALRTGAQLTCSRCSIPVHRSHDHLDVSENGERWTCQGGR